MVSEPDSRRCASGDVGLSSGVDCEISHWLETRTKNSYKVWKPQMVLELDTGFCAIGDAGFPSGVDCEIPRQLERRTKYFL